MRGSKGERDLKEERTASEETSRDPEWKTRASSPGVAVYKQWLRQAAVAHFCLCVEAWAWQVTVHFSARTPASCE